MSKKRVYEVAKDLNVTSKDIITKLESKNVDVHSHMSTLSDDQVSMVKKMYKKAPSNDIKKGRPEVEKKTNNQPKTNTTENSEPKTQSDNVNNNTSSNTNYRNNNNNNRSNNNRSGDNRQGGYRRDNNGGNRSNDNRQGGYRRDNNGGNRSNDNRQGGYRRDNNGENRQGGYRNNNGENRQGGYRNNNGENRQGGYRNNNGENRQGGYRNNNGENRQGGYRNNNGENRQGGYRNNNGENRSGDNRQGGYRGNNNNRSGDNRQGGGGYRGNNNNRSGDNRQGGGGYRGNNNNGGGGYRGNNNNGGGGYRGNNNNGGGGYRGNNNGGGGYRGNNGGGGGRGRGSSDPAPGWNNVKAAPSEKPNEAKNEKRNNKRTFNKAVPAKGKDAFNRFEKKKKKKKQKKSKEIKEVVFKPEEQKIDLGIVEIPEVITVKELAERLHKNSSDIVKILMFKGVMATLNHEIDYETAEEIALELEIEVTQEVEKDLFEEYFVDDEDKEEDKEGRSPVVVVMGHVDHGKTSLLDAIRETSVTEKEAGGITQHIGASVVEINNKKITFLDTPGHEAFTAMRLRGAQVTDVAILVVAADDGVMPQTIEAINHAKAAEVQIIVAINKMDKPGANPDRVKQELSEHGLVPEDWGGDTICVPCSALTKENLDTVLEMVLLVAEMEDLRANPNRAARGSIIEAQLDKGRGTVATVLVQRGTLNVGDSIVAGSAYGRIRAMLDDKGRRVKVAGPSTPVEILGLSEVPLAGDRFFATKNEKEARQVAQMVTNKERVKMISSSQQKVSLDALFDQIQAGQMKELNIVVKADTQGSVEAVKQSLQKLSNEEVVIKTIHGGVGAVTESDVMLASASNAIIIGFNVRPSGGATSVAETEEVDIRLYRIIYNAIEDIEAAMKGMLDPEFVEKVIGHAEVRDTFTVSGVGTIAGSYVKDGKLTRNSQVRVVRDGIVVYEGTLASLKRFKDDAKEVAQNYECGVMLEKFNDVKIGDTIEAFIMEEVPR